MRSIRYSRTFHDELADLLDQAIDRFGATGVAQKRDEVFRTIEGYLAHFPIRSIDPVLGICTCPVKTAPFVLLDDHDDTELRIHLVIHERADRTLVDLSVVVW